MEHARVEAPIDRGMYTGSWYPSDFFPRLCKRFGKARIVAACKARAARGNNISREAQRAEKDGRVQTQTGVAHADRVGCPSALGEIRSEVYRELVPVGGMNGRYPEDLR